MSTRPATPVPDPGHLLGALLRLSHQALMAEVLRALGTSRFSDLQPVHMTALRPLWDVPEGARATELAAKARITKQSMGAVVDQLRERGYVDRVDDPRDRRAKLIRLTPRGREAVRLVREAVRRVEADWARRVGAERLEAVRSTLGDLVSSLDAEQEDDQG